MGRLKGFIGHLTLAARRAAPAMVLCTEQAELQKTCKGQHENLNSYTSPGLRARARRAGAASFHASRRQHSVKHKPHSLSPDFRRPGLCQAACEPTPVRLRHSRAINSTDSPMSSTLDALWPTALPPLSPPLSSSPKPNTA